MNKRLQNLISWLSNAGSLSSDTGVQRLRKAVLTFLTTSYCIFGTFWGIAYLALGLLLPASIPLGYAAMSGASLYYFLRTKRYEFFCFIQLTLILVLPFLLQWSLAYLLIMALSIILNGKFLPDTTLPSLIVIISFVMNIAGISSIVFFLLKYFVSERERAMAALDKAHRRVRHSLSLAMEVQQRLLPQADPEVKGLDIAGKSVYCDETGGDYYDFLEEEKPLDGKIAVVVGDVSDHGIPSALLMATVRALIRQCCSVFSNIGRIVSGVNRQLALDVKDSGRFMTLFYAKIDRNKKSICWLNAGHQPAIVFNPTDGTFDELSDKGSLPLGVLKSAEYRKKQQPITPGQIVVLATDGILEARNPNGEIFGKNRLHDLIRENAASNAKGILNAVFDAVVRFQKDIEPDDDMTLVVIKIQKDL